MQPERARELLNAILIRGLPFNEPDRIMALSSRDKSRGRDMSVSYLDFNDGWPLDSWSVTEPDDGYQAKYIRLLSKFVH